jgi:ribonuclease BN (tRNA processing enzyme)
VFRAIVGCWGNEDLIENAFQLHEYDAPDELTVGPLELRFCPVPHFTRTYAVELSANGGGRLTFGADCSPNDALVRFASDTDVLLIEATLPRAERTGERGHLTPREAGEHGMRARAKRLVLTHYSDELDPEWVRAEAGRAYGGPVELAQEGAVYTV